MIYRDRVGFEKRRNAQLNAYYDELDLLEAEIKRVVAKIKVLDAMDYDEYVRESFYDRRKQTLEET